MKPAASLRAEDRFKPPQAFPSGCYAAVVDGDTDLGDVRILRRKPSGAPPTPRPDLALPVLS
jgi:hypothetical protein